MGRIAHVILILAVAWGSVLPAFGGMRGLMFCFSSGGHVAIEASHSDPSCVSLCEAEGERRPGDGETGDLAPHDCFDVPLPSVDLLVDRVQWEQPTLPGSTLAPALIDLLPVDALRTLDPGRRFSSSDALARGASPGLAALRTIVLRI